VNLLTVCPSNIVELLELDVILIGGVAQTLEAFFARIRQALP
jgi:hypothetical protein